MATETLGSLLDRTFDRLVGLRTDFDTGGRCHSEVVFSALHEPCKPALPGAVRDLAAEFEPEAGNENPPAAVLCEVAKLEAIATVLDDNDRHDVAVNLRAAVAEIRQALQPSDKG